MSNDDSQRDPQDVDDDPQPVDNPLDDAAAGALARARSAAKAAGLSPSSRAVSRRRRRPASDITFSSSRADGRDPVLLGDQLGRLLAERGWSSDVAVGSVVSRWPSVVGEDVAHHVVPSTFDQGILTVQADSTSWATTLRYMTPMLLERLAAEVGPGVVTELQILGPAAPSWRRGGRAAPGGRGPRDTYG
ncbi:hypothetical protein KEM60_00363 [Austwickia sp. TVS 96-490-7B]|uniref:DUF721 domain-containing protein n=1 Tax=Austwickia sp. TVS 96-490-7B TaxID=2830843 RepID=UPI001C595522|nr:DciA family protein [Austwickia sp. TVS 96-490-7B]MBW3084179.1 hypothetical protein [Austwickia sp. TVS 96-490-7B]